MDKRKRVHRVKVLFNNVDFNSRSGPNGFGSKLARQLIKNGHEIVSETPHVAISFIQGYVPQVTNILRLDGIYFNSEQNWKEMNGPIKQSYDLADAVVCQSRFNKDLVFKYFGKRDNVFVVHNGTDIDAIEKINSANTGYSREKTWMCASSWRPHKRLSDNIDFFQSHAKEDEVLFVAGSGDVSSIKKANDAGDQRIKYVGDLSWVQLISLMKASQNFIHLSYLDHCPNVVVDARASNCRIICSSSGGTKEIAGRTATTIDEEIWNFEPLALYSPPDLDFSKKSNLGFDSELDIAETAEKYTKVFLHATS